MKYQVMSVFDAAASVFGRPFFTPTVATGIRGFSDEVNRLEKGNSLNEHPADFQLFHIGEFDDAECKFICLEFPKRVVTATEVKNVA